MPSNPLILHAASIDVATHRIEIEIQFNYVIDRVVRTRKYALSIGADGDDIDDIERTGLRNMSSRNCHVTFGYSRVFIFFSLVCAMYICAQT